MAPMEMRDRIRETSDNLYAAWNTHDANRIVAVYAADVEFVDIVAKITTTGREEIRAVAVDRLDAFPDFSIAWLTRLIDANTSADQWVIRGTQSGEYQGLPPTGNTIEVAGATFSKYDEHGLVIRSLNYIDVPGFIRQLGLD